MMYNNNYSLLPLINFVRDWFLFNLPVWLRSI